MLKNTKELSSSKSSNKNNILEQKPQTSSQLTLRSSREFLPKPKTIPIISEFKLEFILSSEFTLNIKVTLDSNPHKLANYIANQMEFANPNYFNPQNLEENGLQSKYHVK